jgi:hypothetical protein
MTTHYEGVRQGTPGIEAPALADPRRAAYAPATDRQRAGLEEGTPIVFLECVKYAARLARAPGTAPAA